MTEHQIIQGCLKKDRKSQYALYEKYSPYMYPICLRYCKDPSAAADALQNGFINVYKYIDTFREDSNLYSWIKTIVIRTSLEQIRKRKKNLVEDIEEINHVDLSTTPTYQFEDTRYQELLDVVQTLPVGYRLVFTMYVLDEMSHKDIAESLEISENTSRTQLMKARRALQEILKNKPHLMNQ